jgi:DNA-binding MarR family transcriptional regulator
MNRIGDMTKNETLALLGMLMHTGRLTEARLDEALAGAGLSTAKWAALQRLVEGGEAMSLGKLAERLACVKSNVTQLVDRLEADGLARRVPDPTDRRGVLAQVTDEGRQRYAAGRLALDSVGRELLAAYTPDELAQLSQLLARLAGDGH